MLCGENILSIPTEASKWRPISEIHAENLAIDCIGVRLHCTILYV